MKILLLSLIALVFIINSFMKVLQMKHRKVPFPASVADIYNEDEYQTWKNYQNDKLKLRAFSSLVSFIITMILFGFNIHSYVFNWVESLTGSLFFQIALVMVFVSLVDIYDLIFNYYNTFVIEEKYGFNKSTKALFFKDEFIKYLMTIVLGTSFIYLINTIFNVFNNIYLFLALSLGAVLVIVFLIPFLYPLFSKFFNKTTALEEGSLKEKILEYIKKIDFPVENIYVMNASKRSSKSNAYFLGYGKKRRIVLYDTLITNMSEEQVVAVLAHEVGHAKHKDFIRRMPLSLLTIAILLISIFFFVSSKDIATAFGFEESKFLFGVLLFIEIFPLIGILTNLLSNYFSRKYEYQADRFVATTYSKEQLNEALKLITKKDFSDLSPHPFIVLVNHSHPPLHKRIEATR
ncbi:MAG: M48 family metallopeptidase [Candidatus Izemoplasmatales bacterium]|nr:M48 family metallopeptidase [Candidatus Izemoplasmatales bacterium]